MALLMSTGTPVLCHKTNDSYWNGEFYQGKATPLNEQALSAFHSTNEALASANLLSHPAVEAPTCLVMDMSVVAVGTVLRHIDGTWQPLYTTSYYPMSNGVVKGNPNSYVDRISSPGATACTAAELVCSITMVNFLRFLQQPCAVDPANYMSQLRTYM
jgi:hypothetical protein